VLRLVARERFEPVSRVVRDAFAALLLAGLIAGGVGVHSRVERLEPKLMNAQAGFALTYPVEVLPTDNNDGPLDSRIELFENDRQLGPAHTMHENIRTKGGGLYSHWGKLLYFSSSDGSSPRTNERVYTIHYRPTLPPTVLFVLFLAFCLVERRRIAQLAEGLGRWNPAWPALALFVVGLAVRIYAYGRYHDETLESLVKGVPVSDGSDWDAMSSDFALGRQTTGLWFIVWDALRPFRWVFMGAIYALTHPDLRITQAVQILLGAASGVLLFEALRRLVATPLAFLIAACHALSMVEATYDLLPGCEAIGAFLGRLFFTLFVFAASTVGERRNRLLWLGAGASLGLANLTRPELMAALFAVPAALGLLMTRARNRSAGRAWIAGTLVFVLGVFLAMAPRLIRQRIKYDTWSVSANSSEVLFGATTPSYGHWSAEVSALGNSLSIKDRVAFYDAKLHESLKENVGYWIKTSFERLLQIARTLVGRAGLAVTLALLLALALANRSRRDLVLPLVAGALLFAAVAALPEKQLFLLPFFGVLLATALRRPMVLFGAFLTSGIVVVAFSGVSDPRLFYSWQVPALGMAAWFFSALLGLDAEPDGLRVPVWGRASRATLIVSMAALGLFCVGFFRATIATLRHLQPVVPTVANPGDWIAKALADVEAVPYAGIERCLETRPDWIPPDYLMRFQRGESVNHWDPLSIPRVRTSSRCSKRSSARGINGAARSSMACGREVRPRRRASSSSSSA
jgi:hypothetical protein